MKKIREILDFVSEIEFSKCLYYQFLSLNSILSSMKGEKIEKEDMILTPYYICDKGILEIYDYELNVRVVENVDTKSYFLKKTGKATLDEIDGEILEKMKRCYVELKTENLDVDVILGYIEFVLGSKELKDRVEKIDGIYNCEKLFFELY